MENSDCNAKGYQHICEFYVNSILCYIWGFGKFWRVSVVWKTGDF